MDDRTVTTSKIDELNNTIDESEDVVAMEGGEMAFEDPDAPAEDANTLAPP